MRRSVIAGALLTAGIAAAASLAASTPATADPIYQGHFHDVFTGAPYDCEGTPAQDSADVYGNFDWNLRGSSPFPFYRESTNGTLVMTNLKTGGTFTDVIAVNSNDHTIIDNGDGTFTLTISSSGGSASTTPTATSCSRTPARSDTPSTSTTTAPPVTPATTPKSPARSGSCAHPPGTATSRAATPVRTWWSSPARGEINPPPAAARPTRRLP